MVLHMVIHVPVEKAVDRVHVNRPAIQAVIEDIFRQAGVLGEAVNKHQPGADDVRQADEEQRQDTPCGDGGEQ